MGKIQASSYLVVDIGTLFVKYNLFVSFDGERDYLVKSELKYFNKFNYNLFGRDLKRKLNDLSMYTISKVIVIPQKTVCTPWCLPRFEYRDKPREMKDEIKREYQQVRGKDSSVYDWAVLDDVPNADYQSLVLDSMPQSEVYRLGSSIVEVGIRDFVIASPLSCYTHVITDDKAHIIVDIGDSQTRLAVVKSNVVYMVETLAFGGASVTESMATTSRSAYEAMKLKHNSGMDELGTSVTTLTAALIGAMNSLSSRYSDAYRDTVHGYAVIGGSAALDLEEDINYQTVGMDRVYPKLDLVNDDKLLTEARNYLHGSYSSFKGHKVSFLAKGNSGYIDFMAPKSGGMGYKVRELLAGYMKYRPYLFASLATIVALTGTYVYHSKQISETNTIVEKMLSTYQSKETSLMNTQESLQTDYQQLINDGIARKGKNTGLLLDAIQKITLDGMSIRELTFNGDGEIAYIEVVSPSERVVANFMALLQDHAFAKANVTNVSVESHEGSPMYRTMIKAEGRRL